MEFPKWLEDDQLAFLLGSFGQDVMPIVVDKYVDSLKLSDVVLSGSVLCSDLIGLVSL